MSVELNTYENDPRRINEFLRDYWETLRGDKPFPSEKQIEVAELAPIWDSCFLVRREVTQEKPFTYLYLGSSLIEAYGDDLGEREICERLVFPSTMSLVHKFGEVVEKGEPVLEDADFVNTKNVTIRYRSIMLPLADEQGKVGFILGGMRWKAY